MLKLVEDKQEELAEICKKCSVTSLFLFGSSVSGNFIPENSDLDFAVIISDKLSPFDQGDKFFELKDSLELLFLTEIDLISYRVIKNPIFKEELDRTKIELYAA